MHVRAAPRSGVSKRAWRRHVPRHIAVFKLEPRRNVKLDKSDKRPLLSVEQTGAISFVSTIRFPGEARATYATGRPIHGVKFAR